jgi:hypothetical protein
MDGKGYLRSLRGENQKPTQSQEVDANISFGSLRPEPYFHLGCGTGQEGAVLAVAGDVCGFAWGIIGATDEQAMMTVCPKPFEGIRGRQGGYTGIVNRRRKRIVGTAVERRRREDIGVEIFPGSFIYGLFHTREPGDLGDTCAESLQVGGRRLRPYGPRVRLRGVTPRGIVPMNHSNKDGTSSAESEEGRPLIKENAGQPNTCPTQSGEACVSQGADGRADISRMSNGQAKQTA